MTTQHPSLKGKRVVITGGVSGIGLATAERFTAEGARVFLLDRDEVNLNAAISRGAAAGGAAVDVSSEQDVSRAFDQVMSAFDGLDVLIANAGISVRTQFLEISGSQWRRVMATNLDGVFYCVQRAAGEMFKRGGGSVLVTASTNGLEGHPFYADYNASKAALLLLVRTVAVELAPKVRINAVSPGYVLTPMQKAEYTPAMLAAVDQKLPLGRHADPSEVASLFAFLSSDNASYITGQNFVIDGGETAGRS